MLDTLKNNYDVVSRILAGIVVQTSTTTQMEHFMGIAGSGLTED